MFRFGGPKCPYFELFRNLFLLAYIMRKILVSFIAILTFVLNAKSQDTIVSAFFGLDNGLPSLLCNQLGSQLDGMPVNF